MGRLDSIGIEKIQVYPTTLKLDLSLLARDRGDDVGHMHRELMVYERGVNPPWEDTVTMAVNAAMSMLTDADRQSIGLLIVGTETGLDLEKPLSSWVHRYLALPSSCRHFEIKGACYSGTAALEMAASWVTSGFARPGQKALIITTDQSFHALSQPWEYVGGAGAVAMLVSNQADFLLLEPEKLGINSCEVSDVIRPLPWIETGNSEISLFSYMDSLIGSYENYVENVGEIDFTHYFQYNIYHVPFSGISFRAHKQLMQLYNDCTKDEVLDNFSQKTLPSIKYPQKIGATFGGSIFIALLSLVQYADNLKPRDRVGIFSYGSGSCAMFYSALIGDKAKERAHEGSLDRFLERRLDVSVAEYEYLENIRQEMNKSGDFTPDRNLIPGLFETQYAGRGLLVYNGSKGYYRDYGFC